MVFKLNWCYFWLQDPNDPTIGFLLDGMDHLCCLVRKYIAGYTGFYVFVFTNYIIYVDSALNALNSEKHFGCFSLVE